MVYRDIDNEVIDDELERCIVGETLYPVDIKLMEAKLRGTFFSIDSVRAIGWGHIKLLSPSCQR